MTGILEILKRIYPSKIGITAFIVLIPSSLTLYMGKTAGFLEEKIFSLEIRYWTYGVCSLAIMVIVAVLIKGFQNEKLLNSKFSHLLEKYQPTDDQLTDIEMFLNEKRNIMNPVELSSAQLESYQITVVALKPLEIQSKEVLKSTISWLKNPQNKDGAFIEYWATNPVSDESHVIEAIRRILSKIENIEDRNSAIDKIRCVTVPKEILFIDFTVWEKWDRTVEAFANDYDDVTEKKYRLWKLSEDTSWELLKRLHSIKKKGKPKKLSIDVRGETLLINSLHIEQVPHDTLTK